MKWTFTNGDETVKLNVSKTEFERLVEEYHHLCIGPCQCEVEMMPKTPLLSTCPNGWPTKVGAYVLEAQRLFTDAQESLDKAQKSMSAIKGTLTKAKKKMDQIREVHSIRRTRITDAMNTLYGDGYDLPAEPSPEAVGKAVVDAPIS